MNNYRKIISIGVVIAVISAGFPFLIEILLEKTSITTTIATILAIPITILTILFVKIIKENNK